jgi:histidinol-phosphate/aromatic aminotransferase/cobyric acid decarboxylase-like protein
VHGGPDAAELHGLGLHADDVLDFSVNVNPYGAAPAMLAAIRGARLDRYPDARAAGARDALAQAWGVDRARIAIGNGAAELLWSLVGLLCRNGAPLVVVAPTFCEPALAAAAVGAPVRSFVTHPPDFALDVAALADAAEGAGAVYLTWPQNPTGALLPLERIEALAHTLPKTTILLDEAFLPLSHGWALAARPLPDNVVRVRSLTKEHALPGLRVGALIAPASLCQALEQARPAWTVSAPALAAAEAAAGLSGFVSEVRARWLADAEAQVAALRARGLRVLPSATVFHLVEVTDGAAVRAALLAQHRILVRDCASFGLPGYIRVCGRDAPERQRLLSALENPNAFVAGPSASG